MRKIWRVKLIVVTLRLNTVEGINTLECGYHGFWDNAAT